MSQPQRPPAPPALPDDLRGLTYADAAPEQVAEARAAVRRRLAELDAYWTPRRRAEAAEAFRTRLDAA